MDTTLPLPPFAPRSLWRNCIAPKEHGSWSLAFEPLALALLVAPSGAGACLAVLLAAGFFARQPLRIVWLNQRRERKAAGLQALFACATVGGLALAGALVLGGIDWLPWLLPMALAGCGFAYFDVRGGGREEAAEVLGAAAFALAPMAFAILAGWTPRHAVALALIMLGRSVPSVLCIRAFLRAAKNRARRDAPAVVAVIVASVVAAVLAFRGEAPRFAFVAMLGFVARTFFLLIVGRPSWRARTVGLMEAVLGIVFVGGLAIASSV